MMIDFLAPVGHYVKQHKLPNTVRIGNSLGYDCKACSKESDIREGSIVVSDIQSYRNIKGLMKTHKFVHDFYSRPFDVNYWFTKLPREYILQNAAAITFKSPLHQKILMKECGLSHENMFLRVDMIIPSQFRPVNIERRKNVYLIVGRIITRKVKLENYLPLDPNRKYIIVGNPHDDYGKRFIKKMVSCGAECIGVQKYERMPSLYYSAEGVMWKPHLIEPSGNHLIEGRICGCKIDGNKLCGNMSWPWFNYGRNGFIKSMKREQEAFFKRVSEV